MFDETLSWTSVAVTTPLMSPTLFVIIDYNGLPIFQFLVVFPDLLEATLTDISKARRE